MIGYALVVDVGASRMKWALVSPNGYVAQGIIANAEIGTLALRDWQNLPRPVRAIGVNAAGEAARVRVEGQLSRWRLPMQWLVPSERACGVTNRYVPPAQLGGDRWAACVAARVRAVQTDARPRPFTVVNAGTFVTVDSVDADGVFHGGMILPNVRLMMRSLAENASTFKVPAGRFVAFPVNTSDGVYTGALHAVCGAIELARARLSIHREAVRCYITGVASPEIAPLLAPQVEVIDNLVLEGVLEIAAENG